MNSELARTLYGMLSLGSFALGILWIKSEILEESQPNDPWVAVVWIGAAIVLALGALRGVDGKPGSVPFLLVWTAAGLAIGLFIALLHGLSQLS